MKIILDLDILRCLAKYPEGTTKYRVTREKTLIYGTVIKRINEYAELGLLEFTEYRKKGIHGQIFRLTENGRLLLKIFKNIH